MRTPIAPALDQGIAAAGEALFALQRPDGSWQGTLPSSAVSTGSAVIALHVADPAGSADLIVRGAAWLRATQADDGGWGDAPGGPSTLNATAIAVAALRCVEPGRSAEQVSRGLARIDDFGGMAAVADRNRCTLKAVCEHYLALAQLYDPERLSRMPFELLLLPRRLRQKLSFTVPGLASWGVMQARTRRWGLARRWLNRLAEPRALAYLAFIQEYEGGHPGVPGGVEESPLMVSIVCFGLARAGVGLDMARRYRDYLHATVRADGSWSINRDLEFSASMYVTHGLMEAGYTADSRLAGTIDWVRRCQRNAPFPPTGCPPGGWSWSVPSGWPDTDSTAFGLLTLAGRDVGIADSQVAQGVAWLRSMQNRDGSWSCFSRNAGLTLDAPCSVMTAHAALALHDAAGLAAGDPPLARTIRWFSAVQRPDGAIGCLWFRDFTAGTAAVLDALGQLGLGDTGTAVRCREWLLSHQLDDGGWGDGQGSPSSVEETAWAVLGLLSAGAAGHPSIRAGAEWLLAHQKPDGRWEPTLLGVYFLDLMYSYDHTADGYALQALARYRAVTGDEVV